MEILNLLFLAVFVFIVSTFFSRNSDLFSPSRIFLIIWLVVLSLAELKLSYYQFEWSWFSWFVIFVSIISFLLGIYAIYSVNFGTHIFSLHEMRTILSKKDSINENKFFFWILTLFSAYIISYIVIWIIVGYIPAFTAHPNFTRIGWSIFGFGLFIHLTPIILYMVVVYWINFKDLIRRYLLLLIGIITFGTFFLLYQRFSLVFGILLIITYIYYGTNKFNFKNFFILFIPIILLFIGVSSLRESELFIYYLHYTAKMKTTMQYAIFTEPYMYLVMNVENFAFAVEKLERHTYGLYTFDFIIALSGMKRLLKEYFFVSDFPKLLSPFFNTYSAFFVFYRDFGLLGSFIFPFITGAFTSHLYFKMKANPNFHTISIYGMILVVLVFSFFIPLITWLHYVFDFTVIYFVTKLVTKQNIELIHH
ncbi:MAG: oligosaccharide repeat unit polymerase [Ignavibacterium sp.]|nr:oligosaccharide repeat unit polymerase [Ignavibacterium sp.]